MRGVAAPNSPHGRANARLIAAAPDLLEACQALITACTSAPPVQLLQRIEFCLTQAAEAVEKALGPSAHDTSERSAMPREDHHD